MIGRPLPVTGRPLRAVGHPLRTVRAAAGALAVLGMGLAGTLACGRGAASPGEPIAKEIPDAERNRLLATVGRAMSAFPVPPPPYAATPDDSTLEADRRAYWDPASKRWTAPARATFERIFLVEPANASSGTGDGGSGAAADDRPALEYRVFLNHEPELPEDLASEGGAPRQFPLPGTVAVEVTLIGADAGGRVALPISPEDAAHAPTVIRIYIGNQEMESAVRLLLKGGRLAGTIFPSVSRAGGVHSIVVDFYGPRRTVEALAPALDVPALRKLLSESAEK